MSAEPYSVSNLSNQKFSIQKFIKIEQSELPESENGLEMPYLELGIRHVVKFRSFRFRPRISSTKLNKNDLDMSNKLRYKFDKDYGSLGWVFGRFGDVPKRISKSVMHPVCALRTQPVCALRTQPVCALRTQPVCALRTQSVMHPVCALRTQPVCALRTQPVCALRTQSVMHPVCALRTQPVCALRTQSVCALRAQYCAYALSQCSRNSMICTYSVSCFMLAVSVVCKMRPSYVLDGALWEKMVSLVS
ncbi:hypothetical protein Tco_0899934 [Tanacetum coccineum]